MLNEKNPPVLGLLTWWLLGILTKNPAKFNYINLTEKNRDKQYEMSGKIMGIHQNIILIIFVLLNESFLRRAIGTDDSIFLPYLAFH